MDVRPSVAFGLRRTTEDGNAKWIPSEALAKEGYLIASALTEPTFGKEAATEESYFLESSIYVFRSPDPHHLLIVICRLDPIHHSLVTSAHFKL